MKKQVKKIFFSVAFLALALILVGYFFISNEFVDAADRVSPESAACLECHGGSFDKLADKKPAFRAPGNEIINPHQYIPHNNKIP